MLKSHEMISLIKFDGLLEEIQKKDDFEYRIRITLKAIEDALPFNVNREQKNSEESIKLRKQADELFTKEKGRVKLMMNALELYSKSIARAETSSIALAQAYANRSALLFNLLKYEECIRDIERALKLSYPDHLRANLLCRKAKCLKILGNIEAEKICEEARDWLADLNLTDEKKEKLEKKINYTTNVLGSQNFQLNNDTKALNINLPKITPHKKFTFASNAIDIKYNEDRGRHLVVNRDVDPGEVLIFEKPYALFIDGIRIYTHCSHCFARTWDCIPCDYCIHAMYCSEKCKDEAWEKYHDVECTVKEHLLGMGMNELGSFCVKLAALAVRENNGIKKLKEKLKEVDNCKDCLIRSFSKNGFYHSDEYVPLYSLETHENKRKPHEIMAFVLNAAVSLSCIFSYTSFFGNISDKSMSALHENDDAMFFGKLIALHYMSIPINSCEFYELYGEKYNKIGSMIGAAASLINHSCNSNTGKCSVLNNNTVQHMVYALNPIKKGSEILDDYGYHFAFSSKSDRNKRAEHYFFKCNCQACAETWPLIGNLPSILSIVKEKTMLVDISRAIIRSKNHQRTIFEIGLDKYHGDKADILKCLARSISILSGSTKKPSKEYYELLELFKQAFIHIYGNKFEIRMF